VCVFVFVFYGHIQHKTLPLPARTDVTLLQTPVIVCVMSMKCSHLLHSKIGGGKQVTTIRTEALNLNMYISLKG